MKLTDINVRILQSNDHHSHLLLLIHILIGKYLEEMKKYDDCHYTHYKLTYTNSK